MRRAVRREMSQRIQKHRGEMSIFHTFGIYRHENVGGPPKPESACQTNNGVAMNMESADPTRQADGGTGMTTPSPWINLKRRCDALQFVGVAALNASAEYDVWNTRF